MAIGKRPIKVINRRIQPIKVTHNILPIKATDRHIRLTIKLVAKHTRRFGRAIKHTRQLVIGQLILLKL